MGAAMTDEAIRVLLVEDEETILDGLDALFSSQGFVTTCAADGASALETLGVSTFDLVILDLMLPKLDGLSVLRRVRAQGDDTPVLILTAKGREDDVVEGLEAGADDYVTKPFGVRELVARARGLLRRPRPSPDRPQRFRVGGALVDLDAQVVETERSEGTVARHLLSAASGTLSAGVGMPTRSGATHVDDREPVRLTAREASLIGYLVERRHRPVTREELLVDVWGYRDGTVRTRTVDVHVQQLRAKLRPAGGESWIETVRGRGYRFVADIEQV